MPDQSILDTSVHTAPKGYQVTGAQQILIKSVTASFDGTGAGGSWVPALQILDPSGFVTGTYVCGTTKAAGESADVSWFPWGGVSQAASGGSGLPAWYSYRLDFTLGIVPSSDGGDTQPTITKTAAWIMIQTEDGTQFSSGGTPLGFGTVIGAFDVTMTDPGATAVGGDSNGDLLLSLFDGTSWKPVYGSHGLGGAAIGSGYIVHAADQTWLPISIQGDGTMIVPGVSDASPPPDSGAYASQNTARITSNDGTYPAWPFDWQNGDRLTGFFTYPAEVLG